MTLLRISLILISISIVQACSSSKTISSQMNRKDHVILTEETPTPLAPIFIMRGQLIVGDETRSFTPCNSHQQYWVDMDTQSLKKAISLNNEPYQTMYAELIGRITPPSKTGFDSDFSARFVLSSINILTLEEGGRCNQPYRSTTAFGNEPFWSIEFRDEKTLFQQYGADERGLSLSSTRLTPSERKYHFGQGQLTIAKTFCHDVMSDSIYGWSAIFEDDEEKKQGCATLSNIDATSKWVGAYKANSTISTGFSITLELSLDHTAVTTYSYSKGLPTKESGYWQQLNDNQVQVVMTHHQGQRLIAERIFTLENNKIISKHEKVNGKLFPIANGGLTLFKSTPLYD